MNYEALGVFYLGRSARGLLLYDSKDLVTHAACFGMTGSGKTGLCTVLLEEAALDGIPAIAIDPKGDLGNLLLTFPDLRPEDFSRWLPEGLAEQKGLTREELGRQQAESWRDGLAAWGQDGERIRRLRGSADLGIYTPGSGAGLPVSLLKSFDAPPAEILDDRELLRERIQATVGALAGLLRLNADPLHSREHILLSLILDHAWKEGRSVDLAGIIHQIQHPPVARVGVLDLETFYPAADRFALAMLLNNLLASPGFESWLAGEPLEIDRMLHTPEGKPRISIFSIAHLDEAERMFFVSLLLHQTVSWMRRQAGTTSLRALLYMDEIAGYLPPVANPPSKPPMLTLLKQARAFGLGVVLATQNPVDLDYKALGNTGTWFIGRLQTERDQARVLDGLAGAVAATGASFDRQSMERTLAGLGKRVFLMYNVHDSAPEIFETRWALSYLSGPLTRAQIKSLTESRTGGARMEPAAPIVRAETPPAAGPLAGRPVLPPGVPQSFLPARVPAPADASVLYQPALLGCAQVRFFSAAARCDWQRSAAFLAPLPDHAGPVDWDAGSPAEIELQDLLPQPQAGAAFSGPPAPASQAPNYDAWNRQFAQWLQSQQKLVLYRSPSLRQVSQPEEAERDFRIRLEVRGREERDRQVEILRGKYAPKIQALNERIRRAEATLERENQEALDARVQTTISLGATLLGAFLGRRAVTGGTIGKAGSTMRSASRARKQSADVGRASESLEQLRRQLADLEAQFEQEVARLEERVDPRMESFETVEIRPRKSDIAVRLVSLAWAPYWKDAAGAILPAWKRSPI